MANVQLTISALPAHVRTARLMATAVARRAGIAESALDEIRLAVGEACSRAVETHRTNCPTQPIRLELIDNASTEPYRRDSNGHPPKEVNGSEPTASTGGHGPGRFEVVVCDRVPTKDTAPRESDDAIMGELDSLLDGDTPPGGVSGLSPEVGLAVIVGLADHVTIEPNDTGTSVRMSWPLTAGPAEGTSDSATG